MILGPKLKRYIRYAEATVIVVLLAVALFTYRELSNLRKYPVALPKYEFEIAGNAGDTVRTRGTWTSETGMPGTLGTSSIECGKATMRCVESTAQVVFLSGRGLLESTTTQFEVERWTDKEIVARPSSLPCRTRSLVLDLVAKRAHSISSPVAGVINCTGGETRTFDLVAGYAARVE